MCDDTLSFVNEWVWSKARSNGTVFSLYLENKAEFQKSGRLKRLKSSYSLSSGLFEVLNVHHLQDQPLTEVTLFSSACALRVNEHLAVKSSGTKGFLSMSIILKNKP